MSLRELLTIEDTNDLGRPDAGILLISPGFSVPENWTEIGWRERAEPVIVKTPEEIEIPAIAQINMTHLNIQGPDVDPSMRWRIRIWLTDRKKEEIPIGSRLFVPEEVFEALSYADRA